MGLSNVQTVLSGMSNAEQILDNAATFQKPDPLSEQEEATLQKAISAFIDDLGVPCSACRYCCDTCPAELDIPLLIRGYNEKRIGGSTWKVDGLESTKGAQSCLQCGECRAHCPQKIDIPAIMQELSKA